jgi:hypothetical protein
MRSPEHPKKGSPVVVVGEKETMWNPSRPPDRRPGWLVVRRFKHLDGNVSGETEEMGKESIQQAQVVDEEELR